MFSTKPYEHGFVIKLEHVKILDFIISSCILYTKISRMIIFGLVFLVYYGQLTAVDFHKSHLVENQTD